MTHRSILHRSFLLVTLALSACSESQPAPQAAPAVAAAKPKPVAAPKPSAEATVKANQPYVYSYNPLGKRDPFRSPVEDRKTTSSNSNGCSDPLCEFDLDQLTLVAVVTGDANPLAMLQDPHGRGHIIRRKARVGKQGGRVTQILRGSVTVTEYWQGPDGKVNPNPVSLNLKADRTDAPALDLVSGTTYQ